MNSYKGYKLIHKTQLPVIGTPVMTISYPAFGVAMTLKTHDGQWAFFARENWTKEEEMEFDHYMDILWSGEQCDCKLCYTSESDDGSCRYCSCVGDGNPCGSCFDAGKGQGVL